MRAHHGVERDLLAVPEAVVLQPGRVPALAGVVVVADVGVGAGEHHLGKDYKGYVHSVCEMWSDILHLRGGSIANQNNQQSFLIFLRKCSTDG